MKYGEDTCCRHSLILLPPHEAMLSLWYDLAIMFRVLHWLLDSRSDLADCCRVPATLQQCSQTSTPIQAGDIHSSRRHLTASRGPQRPYNAGGKLKEVRSLFGTVPLCYTRAPRTTRVAPSFLRDGTCILSPAHASCFDSVMPTP